MGRYGLDGGYPLLDRMHFTLAFLSWIYNGVQGGMGFDVGVFRIYFAFDIMFCVSCVKVHGISVSFSNLVKNNRPVNSVDVMTMTSQDATILTYKGSWIGHVGEAYASFLTHSKRWRLKTYPLPEIPNYCFFRGVELEPQPSDGANSCGPATRPNRPGCDRNALGVSKNISDTRRIEITRNMFGTNTLRQSGTFDGLCAKAVSLDGPLFSTGRW